ncbi:hypothetical protein PMI21_03193 [Pseudomonas sp. GM18]|uniref:hypothetical protein n=1 Tax=Pseudomonas sp. GM18 TaxID=1144324 RepID=UPI0002724940|nr:hypothetical protein [Pseudomonas sp. GM18]EJM15851.1 hypothetical protein PMI21_03193 [Pseudomonas sp. GM18]
MSLPTNKNTSSIGALTSTGGGVLAEVIKVDGVDPGDIDGHIPLSQLQNGTTARVPRWPNYSVNPDNPDRLKVFFEQDGVKTTIHDQPYTPINLIEILIPLSVALLSQDGVAWLSYIVNDSDSNPDIAPPRKLTIDHTQLPVRKLPEAKFLNATLWGYWNCLTRPVLSGGGWIHILPQLIGRPGDRCVLEWRGYRSLNGVNEVQEAYGSFSKDLSAEDNSKGFDMLIPFPKHIKSLEKNASAVVIYRFYRTGRLVAESEPALVKIDRALPGESLPCYYDA